MKRQDRLANLLRFYQNRLPAEDVDETSAREHDWLDEDDGAAGLPPAKIFGPGGRPLTWKEHLGALRHAFESSGGEAVVDWPAGRELLYVIDSRDTAAQGNLILEVLCRDPKKRGGFTLPRRLGLRRTQIGALPDANDRRLLALLGGTRDPDRLWLDSHPSYGSLRHRYLIPQELFDSVLPMVCATGRAWLRASPAEHDLEPLAWDDGPAWEASLDVRADPKTGYYVVTGCLERGAARAPLSAVQLVVAGGLVFFGGMVARLDDRGAFPWIEHLQRHASLRVPIAQGKAFLEAILKLSRVPRLALPDELRYEEVAVPPRPRLRVRPAPAQWGSQRLQATLAFAYDDAIVPRDRSSTGVFQADRRRYLRRDPAAEREAVERLRAAGFDDRTAYGDRGPRRVFDLPARDLARAVGQLVREGWHVEADGKLYRQPGALHIEVRSGVDWFELSGTVEFGATVAKLPELLAALRRREHTVLLGDGTYGVLPEEWLRRYGMLATLGTPEGEHLRFGRNQVGLLDALVSALPEVDTDAVFTRAREELQSFQGIAPRDPPGDFVGRLREYQRDGLGWLYFIERFGFGGCLADDMGLGKTVQVLALLESRREAREAATRDGVARPGPSLAVVPRSLVFNWKAEALRFTPKLRVLDHTGAGRLLAGEHFDDYDLILTTYGTLRRDAPVMKDLAFDYVILDEAQAIKNAATESAKAARLLRADHRLALSGTPVQNHLGELWSLFEFLNPGMLGAAPAFALDLSGTRSLDADALAVVARGLRPFILRRTKEQVARDLPEKTEQTLFCELDTRQRRQYDELRDHYRAALLDRVARDGIGRSKIQVLEALLRLRQAACHPGLIDRARLGDASAKLDALLPRLTELREEGHKALVFSQFTSFLAILRAELDRGGIPYEYLDGRTRDRAARVERFQSDSDCLLFLVSLKAGGLGLNLTSAEYVFLLDPWWNPAVEAQAIDRTHRIGQTRPVFAYRLIARDTVEEKVLALQETKRALADSIISADESLIRTLTREDLELLLS